MQIQDLQYATLARHNGKAVKLIGTNYPVGDKGNPTLTVEYVHKHDAPADKKGTFVVAPADLTEF